MRKLGWLVAAAVVVVACSSADDASPSTSSPASTPSTSVVVSTPVTAAPTTTPAAASTPRAAPAHRYDATITRTGYGVPHIVADDWGSLGFGQGFAFAQDRACTLIDQVIKVRGERSKWFGPGEDDANVNSDFAYRQLGLHDDAATRFGHQPQRITDMVAGYVAGFNAELGASGPVGWCAGQPWVQPITTTDLYAYLNDVLLIASSQQLIQPIATAQPPAADGTAAPATTAVDVTTSMGSNGWAIGSALSATGGGMLLANPHFPWEGESRLWESQLTLTTGELNVYGATISGVPGVLIGFNDHVAWTHTISAGYRMTLYSLDLVPGDPTILQVRQRDAEDDLEGRDHRRQAGRRLDRPAVTDDVVQPLRADAQPAVRLDDRHGVHDARRQPRQHHVPRAVPRDGRGHEHGRVHRRAPHGERRAVGQHGGDEQRRPGVVRRHRGDAEPVAGGHRRLAGRGRRRWRRQGRPGQRGDPARRLRPGERMGRRPGRGPSGDPAVQRPAAARAQRLRVQRQRLALAGQPGPAVDRLLAADRSRGCRAVVAHP